MIYLQDPDVTIHCGDVLDVLPTLPADSADCVVTSPPYWGLRDYGVDGQLGLEQSFDEFVDSLVRVFREVRRVLAPHGTCWLNLGDSYANGAPGGGSVFDSGRTDGREFYEGDKPRGRTKAATLSPGLKPKDLIGQPWAVAFAFRADGWYLRSCVIWAKPNPMPESVTDRPTTSHEYVFLLTKQSRYFYDADAVREPAVWERWGDQTIVKEQPGKASWITPKGKNELSPDRRRAGFNERWNQSEANGTVRDSRNLRSVWTIPTQPYPEAHFATYPEELVRRCLLAGCPDGGTVLDPFLGSGTTAHVARKHGRKCIGIELNESYCELASKRLAQLSLLAEGAA